MNKLINLLVLFVIPCSFCIGQLSDEDIFVDSLMRLMTLEEKVGQMNQYNGFWNITGPSPADGNAKLKYDNLASGMVGSMLNVKGVQDVRKLQEIVVNESRLGIPIIFGYDVIHGLNTVSPIPLAEAASWDLQAIQESAEMAAKESSAMGLNWTFAPMVDISRDARWGRVMEGAGEDPYLGSKIGVARVKGFQGQDLSSPYTIAACAKHFAAYGFSESGKDYNTVDISSSTLYNVVLPPFQATVDADVKTLMNSFNILNGVPVTASEFLQRDILKEDWGFDGFVVSDWGSGREMINHGYVEDLRDVAVKAANAGSDMDMESYAYVTHLVEAVRSGDVSMRVIDDAVRRILSVKYQLGLFQDPFKYCDEEREAMWVNHEDHISLARDMARKSIVLLKNEGNVLPLKPDQKGIAVIGQLANDKDSPLGNWRIGAKAGSAVSLIEGLAARTDDYKYEEGPKLYTGSPDFIHHVDINNTDKSGMEEAVALAKASEVVIMVLGEHGLQSGEGRSRASLGLPSFQQELLEAVHRVNSNIVLVLMNGRPLTIPWAAEHVPVILESWQLGTQSGHAITDVLYGDYNPSGKLPMTFPRDVGQVPIYYNYFSTGRGDTNDLVFWSHYSDMTNDPLYPFGYGLSYTEFEYSDLQVDDSDRTQILVSALITNSGDRSGEEVVQLYIRDKFASNVRPVKELKGFEKIKLEAGQSMRVNFMLTDDELGFYNNDGKFVVESGDFDVMVGTNSQEGLMGSFELR